MTAESTAKLTRSLVGTVISDKRDKTCTVVIKWSRRHKLYDKVIRKTTKLHVHDKDNSAMAGDLVRIKESRPFSKTKSWELVEVLERAS